MSSPALTYWAEHVPEAYDRIAERWAAHHARKNGGAFPARRFLEPVTAGLPAGARVLDVGCGTGVPIAAWFVRHGLRITGLDASHAMLAIARTTVPGARFVHRDIRTSRLRGRFDALVAWDSVFHLPRREPAALFVRFRAWLRPQGRLLLSLRGSAATGFTSTMFGERLFYSGHAPTTARALLVRAGFTVEHWEIDDPSSCGHLVIVARASG